MSGVVGEITKKLLKEEPRLSGLRHAAISMILAERRAPKVLLIERAEREGDPWSGQIAFPGGKSQAGDAGVMGTAMRETAEEVGINLRECADFLGYGEPLTTHTGTIEVVPCAFLARDEPPIRTNEEVASYKWVEISNLPTSGVRTFRKVESVGLTIEMPAILISDYVVWGLTLRILTSLLSL